MAWRSARAARPSAACSITNFTLDGIRLRDGSSSIVEDNYVGAFVGAGVEAAGNGSYGLLALSSPDNVIRRNVIGGNGSGVRQSEAGVGQYDDSGGAVVEDNLIGIGPGDEVLANEIGVTVTRSNDVRLDGNTIAHNTGNGVLVFGAPALGNRIAANRIHNNGLLGIDLGGEGVTPNDPGDGDSARTTCRTSRTGLSAELIGGQIQITGRLDAVSGPRLCDPIYSSAAARSLRQRRGRDLPRLAEAQVPGTISFTVRTRPAAAYVARA